MTFSELEKLFGRNVELEFVGCDGKQRITKETFGKEGAIKFLKNKSIRTKNTKSIGLVIPEGFMCIDIDEGKEKAKRAIKALSVKTLIFETVKGVHVLFKTNKKLQRRIGVITPFGLKCDQLVSKTSYIILPPNNKNRKVFMKEKVAKLPDFFQPLTKQKESCLDLEKGDGRNDRLLSILSSYMLAHKNVSTEDLEDLAHVINNIIFADPLEEKELYYMFGSLSKYQDEQKKTYNGSVKIRDDRSSIEYFDMSIDRYDINNRNRFLLYSEKGKPVDLDHMEIADLLVESGKFCVVNQQMYRYVDGVYTECGQEVRDLIKTLAGVVSVTKQGKVMEAFNAILDDIRLKADPSEFNSDPNLINFDDCVYNISTGRKEPHDAKFKFMSKIPHKLNYKRANASFKDCAFHKLLDKMELSYDDRKMLLEFMAYCLIKDNNLRAFLMLLGQGGSGKSALISFFQGLIGEQNTSAIALQDIGKRFQAAGLEHKMLNVCADNSTAALYQIDVIKRLTGGDTLTCEYKGRDPYPFKPYAKLCFSFNQMPRQLEEKSDAYYDRLRILRLDKKINLSKRFASELYSEKTYSIVLNYLLKLLPLRAVHKSKQSLRETEIARRRSDSIYDYLQKKLKWDEDKYVEKEVLFENYVRHCNKEQRTAHAYYIFFDYILDYPNLQEVVTEDNVYIKGLHFKHEEYKEPKDLRSLLEEEQQLNDELEEKLEQEFETIDDSLVVSLDFTNTYVREFDFTGVRIPLIREFDFTNAYVREFDFTNAYVREFDFTGVRIPLIREFDFTNVHIPLFVELDFTNAYVREFDFTNAYVREFDFTNAYVREFCFRDPLIVELDFRRTFIREFDFRNLSRKEKHGSKYTNPYIKSHGSTKRRTQTSPRLRE